MGTKSASGRPILIQVVAGRVLLREQGRGRNVLRELTNTRPLTLPFLRWAGGKQWIARIATHLLPRQFNGTYFEPFLGAANVFFAINPQKAVLSDVNAELIRTYQAIAGDVDSVIRSLRTYRSTKQEYLRMRASRPRADAQVAARFVYLNKTAWNGLYRVNPRGQFNVPYGGQRELELCPVARLHAAKSALRHATISVSDFEVSVAQAKAGDLVYLDPPYITGHTNNGFLSYNSHLFSWEDQLRLSTLAMELSKRGVHVLVSNANHQAVFQLYGGFYRYVIERNSLIGGWEGTRGRTRECLLSNYPILDTQSERIRCPQRSRD